MHHNRLKVIVFVAVLTWFVTCGSVRAENAEAMDKARMDAVVQFAETVLKHGRDTCGEKHTPLFTDTLDVDTMKAPEKTYLSLLRSVLGDRSGSHPKDARRASAAAQPC